MLIMSLTIKVYCRQQLSVILRLTR